jgi:hypothetical protein
MVSKDREEMSGGQHRDDETNGPSRSGERETERRSNHNPALLRRHTGVLRKIKLRQNVLDGADFVRDVRNIYLKVNVR